MKASRMILFLWVVCFGVVCSFFIQRQQLMDLRARSIALATQGSDTPSPDHAGSPDLSVQSDIASPELLRLRSEVTRLNARKRELAAIPQETEKLRLQLASAQTNGFTGNQLPTGYMRKTEARLVGFTTPENTIESFLWAVQHRDVTNLMRAISPAGAQIISSGLQSGTEPQVFKGMEAIPGMGIQNRQNLPDGSVELEITIGPGVPTDKVQLRSVNGEWKLDFPF